MITERVGGRTSALVARVHCDGPKPLGGPLCCGPKMITSGLARPANPPDLSYLPVAVWPWLAQGLWISCGRLESAKTAKALGPRAGGHTTLSQPTRQTN